MTLVLDTLINKQININPDRLLDICTKWEISELAVFGSVLREDFAANSDIDILISFNDSAKPTIFDHVSIRDELVTLFNRPVDVVTKKAIEKSRNQNRQKSILSTAKVLYAES